MHQYSLQRSIQVQAEVLPMYLGPRSTEHTQAAHCNILFNRKLHMQWHSLKIPKELRYSSDLETCSHGNTPVQCIIQGLMVMLVSTNLWLCLTCKSIAWAVMYSTDWRLGNVTKYLGHWCAYTCLLYLVVSSTERKFAICSPYGSNSLLCHLATLRDYPDQASRYGGPCL